MSTITTSIQKRFFRLARPRTEELLPVTLTRNRVYVLPTAFGAFFMAVLLVMGVGALNYNNNPGLLLTLLLAGTSIASLLSAHLQLSGLRVESVSYEPVAAGTELALHVYAHATEGRRRVGLQVDYAGARSVLSLSPVNGVAILNIPTHRRGAVTLSRIRISTTYPLGLARAWSYVWPDQTLLVYPKPELAPPPLPEGAGEHAQSRIQSNGDDVHHLRQYRRGDPIRAIAWKPSARRNTLVVREYEHPRGTDVLLSWEDAHSLPYEQKISRLAAWIDQAEREERRYILSIPGHAAIGPGRGHAQRAACLQALALLPHQNGVADAD